MQQITDTAHDLEALGAPLREQPSWQLHGHGAVTLLRAPDLRIVLLELRAGGRLQKHRTVARVSIHALRGRVRIDLGGHTVALAAGQLVTLERNVAHDVIAEEDSSVLVTISWHRPEGAS